MSLFFGTDDSDDDGTHPDDLLPDDYPVTTVGDDVPATLQEHRPDRHALAIRPIRDNGGIEAMDGTLDGIHEQRTRSSGLVRRSTANAAPHHSFEVRYGRPYRAGEKGDSRAIMLQYVPAGELAGRFQRQLQRHYPESQIEAVEPRFLDVGSGSYLAGARLGLQRYTLYPIKNCDMPGFERDPTGAVLEELVGPDTEAVDVTVQICFRAAKPRWLEGVDGGPSVKTLTHNLQEPTYEEVRRKFTKTTIEHPPSKSEKRVAKLLSEQSGKGWEIGVRIFATGEDRRAVQRRVCAVAAMFDHFYELHGEQTFIPEPIPADQLVPGLLDSAERSWPSNAPETIVKGQREVAGLVNIPTADDVATGKMQWALSKAGRGVPPGTPRADWDDLGVDPMTASKEEKQVALLDNVEQGDPFWWGVGVKHGTEAGQPLDITNPHKLVHGESGTGKTTYLANDIGQQLDRYCSGLYLDPKGSDIDEFLAEWPDDRPDEDLIYMDLSGEYDRIPRFNFMEVPEYLEISTREHTEFLEALAENILRMVGAAGGSDNYVGGLMKRVVKTVVRALARRGETATLFDVATVCSSGENLEAFAQGMPDDRFHYLRQRAEQLGERDDTELDPLAGRLDEWVLNDNVRELICARDPSFSVHEAVRDGKTMFVRFSDSGSQIVKRMVGNALINRTYFAQRHHRPEHAFELVADEAQTVINSASDIELIMDQGREFDYRVTVACQRPKTQLPEGVRDAVLGNAATVVSYSSGRKKEAKAVADQHQDVEAQDLVNLSKYRFYMATEDEDGNSTYSYKVDAFRAPTEARAMVADDPDPDEVADEIDAKVEELKQRSLDRYGLRSEDVEEISIYDTTAPAAGDDADISPEELSIDGLNPAGHAGDMLAKAAYEEGLLRHGDPQAPVDRDVVAARLRRYLDLDELAISALADLVERTEGVDYSTAGGDELIMATEAAPARFLPSGDSSSAGGLKHRDLLRDSHALLTQLGLGITVPTQEGGRDIDGVGHVAETMRQIDAERPLQRLRRFEDEYPIVSRLTDGDDVTIEAEASTSEHPGQTIKNLAKAAEVGQKCLFVAREEAALRVYNALTDPQLVKARVEDGWELYNDTAALRLRDGRQPVRPADAYSTDWVRRDNGTLVCCDSEGRELAAGETVAALRDAEAAAQYPAVLDEGEDTGEDWKPIKDVVAPGERFGTEEDWPTPDDWEVLAVPHDAPECDQPAAEALRIVEDGELMPLASAADGAETSADDSAEKSAGKSDLASTLEDLTRG